MELEELSVTEKAAMLSGGSEWDSRGNEKAGIPTADVIPYYPDCQQSSFGPTWHTIHDTMDHIDKGVLQAVGQTMIQMLWTL